MLTSKEAALNRETYVTPPVSREAVRKAGKSCDVNRLWSRELQTWGDWLHSGCPRVSKEPAVLSKPVGASETEQSEVSGEGKSG